MPIPQIPAAPSARVVLNATQLQALLANIYGSGESQLQHPTIAGVQKTDADVASLQILPQQGGNFAVQTNYKPV